MNKPVRQLNSDDVVKTLYEAMQNALDRAVEAEARAQAAEERVQSLEAVQKIRDEREAKAGRLLDAHHHLSGPCPWCVMFYEKEPTE